MLSIRMMIVRDRVRWIHIVAREGCLVHRRWRESFTREWRWWRGIRVGSALEVGRSVGRGRVVGDSVWMRGRWSTWG